MWVFVFTQTWPLPATGTLTGDPGWLLEAAFALVGAGVDGTVAAAGFFILRRCDSAGLGLGFATAFASAGVTAAVAASAFLCRWCFAGLAAGNADGDGWAFCANDVKAIAVEKNVTRKKKRIAVFYAEC